MQNVVNMLAAEARPTETALAELESHKLQKRATRWDVEVPNDAMVEAEGGGWYIGGQSQDRVRRLIEERRDAKIWWLTKMAGAIIATVAGLLTIWGLISN